MGEYKRELDVELYQEGVNVKKDKAERWLNVVAYQYDGGEKKVRIQVKNKNTNPNCDPKKTWVPQKGISSLTKDEVKGLIKLLEKALVKI